MTQNDVLLELALFMEMHKNYKGGTIPENRSFKTSSNEIIWPKIWGNFWQIYKYLDYHLKLSIDENVKFIIIYNKIFCRDHKFSFKCCSDCTEMTLIFKIVPNLHHFVCLAWNDEMIVHPAKNAVLKTGIFFFFLFPALIYCQFINIFSISHKFCWFSEK